MDYVEWEIKARQFGVCNCDYGCPCQFNAMPTHADCMSVTGYEIDEGYFGKTRLDGLRAVLIFKWPGPVHEGNGAMQAIIDQRADEAQREGLRKVLHGEESEPNKSMWSVFMSTMNTVLEPLYEEIRFEVDVNARLAKLVVPGHVESTGEPIRNPVTGAEHRVRIDLPEGFEYTVAEMGSGTSRVIGALPMEMTATYGQFNYVHVTTHGIVR